MSGEAMDTSVAARPGARARLQALVDGALFQRVIMAVIWFNAVLLGLETDPALRAEYGPLIRGLDRACLGIFVAELALKFAVRPRGFFRDGWNVFDLTVVGVALLSVSPAMSALRTLRVLRLARMISLSPSLRHPIEGLLKALPAAASAFGLLGLIFYIFAVIGTGLFQDNHPQWFGDMGRTAYTLFQVMTLESWSMGIARPVMETHPNAWLYFVCFILVAAFTILNLFIGVIVDAMASVREEEARANHGDRRRETADRLAAMEERLARTEALLEEAVAALHRRQG